MKARQITQAKCLKTTMTNGRGTMQLEDQRAQSTRIEQLQAKSNTLNKSSSAQLTKENTQHSWRIICQYHSDQAERVCRAFNKAGYSQHETNKLIPLIFDQLDCNTEPSARGDNGSQQNWVNSCADALVEWALHNPKPIPNTTDNSAIANAKDQKPNSNGEPNVGNATKKTGPQAN